jgi:hypothetical protein
MDKYAHCYYLEDLLMLIMSVTIITIPMDQIVPVDTVVYICCFLVMIVALT